MSLVEKIVEGIENREPTLAVFLDLSKAFDCVNHNTLLDRLESYGIRGVPLSWLDSYLQNRTQRVQIGRQLSSNRTLRYGVPQGSILSPLLFLIYVNDIDSSLQHGSLVQYADDTTLCFKSNTITSLEIQAFEDLNSCIQSFSLMNLQTNSTKSNVIHFKLRQSESEHGPAVMMGDTILEEAKSVKFLGMHLDKGLTWKCHINEVCSKISSGIFVLRKLSRQCPTQILIMAYYGLIYPHLSYGIALWGGCSNNQFTRVFRLQKKAVRVIAKLPYRESCKSSFIGLELLTLPCIYILETSNVFLTRCGLTQGQNVHNYNTRGRNNYRTGQHRTAVYEHLPSQAGVSFVNSLPNPIKAMVPKALKAHLKKTLITKAFYSVGEFLTYHWETEAELT